LNSEGKRVRQRDTISTGISESHTDSAKGKSRNKGKAEALIPDAEAKKEAELSRKPGVGSLLFADFMERMWLPEIKKTVREKTFSSYAVNVKAIIAPYFRKKGILLCNLTAEDINAFYDDLMEGWDGRDGVTGMTVSKKHANISKALKFAAKPANKFIPSASAILEHVECPQKGKYNAKFLREQEYITISRAAKGTKLELGVYLGGIMGLRLSEAVGLRWRSIDFENNRLTIEHTVTVGNDDDGKTMLIPSDLTKNKSSRRTLPFDDDFKAFLLKLKAEQELNRKLCGNCWCKEWDGYIYVDTLGKLIHPNYITTAFPAFLLKNEFERMRFHDLRHTCASMMIARSNTLLEVQQWLGHSSYEITANLYIHLTFENKVDASIRMLPVTQKVFAHDTDDTDNDDYTNDNAQK
jgi:integrase